MWKKVSLYISSLSLRLVLFIGITLVCFALIATNPTHIKNLTKESGIYQGFVPAVINDTINRQPNSTVPLKDKLIQNDINNGFTPESLQRNTETVIDSTYLWLDGESQELKFEADFTKERQQTADNIAKTAFNRVKDLPVCFAVPPTFDPFTVGCQPPYTNLLNEQSILSTLIAGDEGILPKAVYTEKDLPKNSDGQYIYEKYSYAPSVFNWLKLSPYILGLILIILSFLIVILDRNKREGFRRLGAIYLGSGITLIITPIILSFIMPKLTDSVSFSTTSQDSVSSLTTNLANTITNDFYALLLNVSIQVIVIGAFILMAEKFTRPKSKYANAKFNSGLISSHAKKPSASENYKPVNVPMQSSEESTRRKPKKTRNKKYRKIPNKGDK